MNCTILLYLTVRLISAFDQISHDGHALRARLAAYENAWSSQRYDRVWRMMSQHLHDGNDNDESEFADSVRKSGAVQVKLEVLDIHITRDKAVVRARVTYQPVSGSLDPKSEIQGQQWIKVRGQWYFDDYHSVP